MESIKGKNFFLDIPHGTRSKILTFIILCIGALYLGNRNFLLYHTIVDLFGAIIGLVMAIISVNTYKLNKDNRIVFLGITYGFASCFYLIHIFIYKGMTIFGVFDFNNSIQIWVVGRYLQSISLLICFMSKHNKYSLIKITLIYLVISVLSFIFIFNLNIFPDCYKEGIGFTPFKIVNGGIDAGILLIGLLYFLNKKRTNLNENDIALILAIICSIISEIFLISTTTTYDIISTLGHMFQFGSFYFIYIALVQSGLKDPHYSLIKLNNILINKNEDLEKLVNELKIEYEQRIKVEEENERKKQILNGILESVADGIKVIDENDKIIHMNSQIRKMLGINFEITSQTSNKEIINFFKKQVKKPEEFLRNIEKEWESPREYIQHIHLKNGKIFETSSLPFADNSVINGKLIICRDITEKRKIEELQKQIEIRQALLEKAREFDELKTNFFCTISHELKTPINIILGVIQLISNIRKSKPECESCVVSGRYINMMKQNCFRLIKLSNNLIDITKLDAGYTEMKIKNHNIVSVVEDITLSVTEFTKSKDISLVFDTDVEEKIIACDDEKLERVMLNLLSNAIKFTEPKGKIEVNIKDGEEYVVISVKDNGIGIPEDKIDIVFDRFRQVDSTLARQKEGSGIGLALVKSIVEKHGGKISLKSEIGKNSEFIIQLPVKLVMNNNTVDEVNELKEINVDRIKIEFSDIYELNTN